MRNRVYTNYTLEGYSKKYKNRKHRLLKYTKKQVEEFDKKYGYFTYSSKTQSLNFKNYLLKNKYWALINDTYYEIPKPINFTWFRNLNVGIQAATCLLGAGIVATAITLPLTILNNSKEYVVDITGASLKNSTPKKVGNTLVFDLTCADSSHEITKISKVIKGDVVLNQDDYIFDKVNHQLTIKKSGLDKGGDNSKIKIEVVEKEISNFYNIDWGTTKHNGKTLYEMALEATSVKFVKDDSNLGEKCGETDDDNIYFTFDSTASKELKVWSNRKIAFTDNDRFINNNGVQGFFQNCSSVVTFDFSNIDTSKVTQFGFCFENCKAVTNLDLSTFNTSSAKSMVYMFNNNFALESLNISSFDTAKVEDMSSMFLWCKKLKTLEVSNFNTSNVTDMSYMFGGCETVNSLNVSSFNTEKVKKTKYMFYYCSKLKTIFASNKFVSSKVTDSEKMFLYSEKLIGGKNTAYSASHLDKEYARIDDPDNNKPGYFTENE